MTDIDRRLLMTDIDKRLHEELTTYRAWSPDTPAGLQLKTALTSAFPGEMDGPNADLLMSVCIGLGRFLCAKNKAYGDSALRPLRVFSKASPDEQLRVRIDDKLSRLSRGSAAGEDAVVDLAGYLVLLLAAREEG